MARIRTQLEIFRLLARNTASPGSDVDLLVEWKTPSYTAMLELSVSIF